MKNLFLVAIAILGFSAASFAQVQATATTSARIITPIAISKSVNLDFGAVAVSPTTAGTVVLVPAGTRSKTGGVTLPVTTGTVSAAKFTVTGLDLSTYSIALPGDITLSDGASHEMIVGTFTSTPSSTGVLSSGTQDIFVGATLNVGAAQAAGLYTNAADLVVTVNYN